MRKFLLKRVRSDRGDSTMISLVIVIPVVLAVLFTIIDSGIYFTNQHSISSAARDAARTVAIYGGNGTKTDYTTIERAYGKTNSCPNAEIKALTANQSSTECGLINFLAASPNLIGVKINKVSCSPSVTSAIGQDVSCTVDWEYGGIPGSSMGFIRNPDTGESPFASTKTVGSSQSEVKLRDTDLVPRPQQ